jgi:hypothetical protein
MRTLTINLTEEAYQALREALAELSLSSKHSVTTWLETELNDNTDVIIEMLLSDE